MSRSRTLLLDVGNLQVKANCDGAVSSFDWRKDNELDQLRALITDSNSTQICFACSAPQAMPRIESLLSQFDAQQICQEDIPLRVLSEGTGVDRLLASLAAKDLAEGAAIVVDCGTAITIDVVDAEGCFRGGSIGLGLSSQVTALNKVAPHLGPPESPNPRMPIPQTTSAAVFDGIYRSTAASICGLVNAYQQVVGLEAEVFVCGGDAKLLLDLLPEYKYVPDLLFTGMRLALASNEI